MTIMRNEWKLSGRNDSNTEGMKIMRKEWHRVISLKKKFSLAQIFLQLGLAPLLGHKEAIGTLGYPIASKLGD